MDIFVLIILLLLMSLAFVVAVLSLAEILMGVPRLLRRVVDVLKRGIEDG